MGTKFRALFAFRYCMDQHTETDSTWIFWESIRVAPWRPSCSNGIHRLWSRNCIYIRASARRYPTYTWQSNRRDWQNVPIITLGSFNRYETSISKYSIIDRRKCWNHFRWNWPNNDSELGHRYTWRVPIDGWSKTPHWITTGRNTRLYLWSIWGYYR